MKRPKLRNHPWYIFCSIFFVSCVIYCVSFIVTIQKKREGIKKIMDRTNPFLKVKIDDAEGKKMKVSQPHHTKNLFGLSILLLRQKGTPTTTCLRNRLLWLPKQELTVQMQ